jgi:hypothetical protein
MHSCLSPPTFRLTLLFCRSVFKIRKGSGGCGMNLHPADISTISSSIGMSRLPGKSGNTGTVFTGTYLVDRSIFMKTNNNMTLLIDYERNKLVKVGLTVGLKLSQDLNLADTYWTENCPIFQQCLTSQFLLIPKSLK